MTVTAERAVAAPEGRGTGAAAPAGPAPSPALSGLQALAGSSSNAVIARSVLAREGEQPGQTAQPSAAAPTAAPGLDDPIPIAVGLLGKSINERLKKGEKKTWEAKEKWGGDTWALPRITFPLGPILRGYVEGSATASAGVGARGEIAANREDAGDGKVKDTVTVTGKANVTGGLSGGLKAGLAAGIPQVLECRAGVSGKISLDGKGSMDINTTMTRTGPATAAGGWTVNGDYHADIDGAITASLKGEITLKVLWWDKTLASFNIANWDLGKARVAIKGKVSSTGGASPPKVTWYLKPPKPPTAQHTEGSAKPPPKPADKQTVAPMRRAAGAGDDPPSTPLAQLLARVPEGETPAGGQTPGQPEVAAQQGGADPATGAPPANADAAGAQETTGEKAAAVTVPGEEPKIEMP